MKTNLFNENEAVEVYRRQDNLNNLVGKIFSKKLKKETFSDEKNWSYMIDFQDGKGLFPYWEYQLKKLPNTQRFILE